MILSVIVPTYNVELWIEKCLLSIVNQNIDPASFEIIVVNDESPDKSAEIARDLAKKYSQISVINQKNKGLSGARNTGIRHSKGKYLLFVDSDDYLEPNVLKDMIDFTESNELEIAMFGQNMVINDIKKSRDKHNPETTQVMTGIELFFNRTSDSACKYLINSDYLKRNNIYFFEQAVYLEDGEWSPRLFVYAKRTAYKGIYFYNYVLRGNSLVTSGVAVTQKALDGYLKSANNLIDFQSTANLNLNQKQFINQTIAKFVLLPITLSATKKGLKQITNIRRTILKAGFNNLNSDGVVGMRLKHVLLYNKSFYLFYCYLLLKNTFSFIK